MKLGKKSVCFLVGGLVLSLGFGVAASGCGQCAAACEDGVGFEGNLPAAMADKPPLSIDACYESECKSASLTFDANGIASCDGGVFCEVTANADGTMHLHVSIPVVDATPEKGGKATIHVEKTADNTVLVDKQATLDSTQEGEICGMTCQSGSVTWGS